MNRVFALLAGLVLATQVAALPVAATELHSSSHPLLLQDDRPLSPGPPAATGAAKTTLTAERAVDVRAMLFIAAWDGDKRQALYIATNIGEAAAKNVQLVGGASIWNSNEALGAWQTVEPAYVDLLPGETKQFMVSCNPPKGWICTGGSFMTSHPFDANDSNNMAWDKP